MILQTTILPEQATEMAWHVDNLFWFITVVTTVVSLGVYAAVFGFCVVYRRKPDEEVQTPRILGSHKLELIWSILPLGIFLVMFAWGAWVYNMAMHAPDDVPEMYVVGKQWMWKVQYPGGQRVILGANSGDYKDDIGGEAKFEGVMVLAVNKPVKVIVTSEDVIHDFGIPAFRSKLDAVPGRYTTTWYKPTKTGEYHVFCDQYCGTNHSLMVGKVRVVEQAEYDAWLEGTYKTGPGKNAVDGSLAHQGRQLFMKLNCIQCHNTENPRAPILEEVFKSKRAFKGGTAGFADENYLRESIRKPRAKIREGWEPIMPAYGTEGANALSEDDLVKVIAYIKSLRKGETPVLNQNWVPPIGSNTGPAADEPQPTPPSAGGMK
ncbi:cytochrome c oxidase subunit II [Zavarzinella formosa]|uniref:cytochrome c oxidase subunit II n=1 Tax=Zavarzinella formosa TaxID=360055 RepID=UPI0002FB722E|nr:cytochrome c oxidase subunit II [Zavarzinella formosa]